MTDEERAAAIREVLDFLARAVTNDPNAVMDKAIARRFGYNVSVAIDRLLQAEADAIILDAVNEWEELTRERI